MLTRIAIFDPDRVSLRLQVRIGERRKQPRPLSSQEAVPFSVVASGVRPGSPCCYDTDDRSGQKIRTERSVMAPFLVRQL
ncbi:hypothetical protein VTN02DRAFT_4378 [Thermoascus thermophilus]